MTDWKLYQDETAKLFRELGCTVETDFEIAGARGKHLVDVYIVFRNSVCASIGSSNASSWKRAVPKEKVLALKAIVDDIGADPGILVSEAGHRSGALAVARHTNITLVSLDELRKAARGELLFLGLLEIQRRAMRMKDYVFSLWRTERHEKGFSTSKPRPGIDGKLATTIGGTVSIIGTGAERALLGTFPAPLRFLEDRQYLGRGEEY